MNGNLKGSNLSAQISIASESKQIRQIEHFQNIPKRANFFSTTDLYLGDYPKAMTNFLTICV